MGERATAIDIGTYIAGFPAETQAKLEELRTLMRAILPEASETISYGIPTFDHNGEHVVHFAGYAKHVGFYPTSSAIAAFVGELRPYKHGKGSVQFPLNQPLSVDLIRRTV